jgi:hypothetical protein
MYCQHCGAEVDDNAQFCRNCGQELQEQESTSNKTIEESEQTEWDPKAPIISASISVLLLWTAIAYRSTISFVMFGIPAILIIPRIRRPVIKWTRETLNEDPTSKWAVITISAFYVIAAIAAAMGMLGYVGNNEPTLSDGEVFIVWFLMLGIVFVIGAVSIGVVRLGRKIIS